MHRLLSRSTKSLIPVFLLSLFITSCSQRSASKEAVIKAMAQSLTNSNSAINISSSQTLHSLEKKITDYATKEKAEIWLPIAKQVSESSLQTFNYIEELKKLKGMDLQNAITLLNRLLRHREQVLNAAPSIRQEFEKNTLPAISRYDSTESGSKRFYLDFFSAGPEYDKAILAKFQNDTRIAENRIVTFCNEQIGSTDGDWFYDYYSAIVGQSSNIIKPGGELKISAGVGSYSRAVQPKIRINGMLVPLNEEAVATYKLKVPQKPGEYKVPVLISYFNQTTAKDETKLVDVKYTVTKPCDQ